MGLFTDKINAAIDSLGISIREMGRQAEISPGYAHQIVNGVIPDDPIIRRLCKVLGLNEVEMKLMAHIEKQDDEKDKEMYRRILELISDSHGIIQPQADDIEQYQALAKAAKRLQKGEITRKEFDALYNDFHFNLGFSQGQNMVRVPVFDAQGGPAGAWSDGGYPVGEAPEYEMLPAHMVDENSFIVVVHGDSMAPGLPEGSRALIVPSQELEQGKLCFASFPGEDGDRMVKRYYRYGDTIVLKSDNPAHQDITLDASNGHGVHIYRVTWIRE
jgi:phage repressor protein C with HTH and peptisase S24 domain